MQKDVHQAWDVPERRNEPVGDQYECSGTVQTVTVASARLLLDEEWVFAFKEVIRLGQQGLSSSHSWSCAIIERWLM